MHVGKELRGQAFVAGVVLPAQGVAQKVALGGREAVDFLAFLVLLGFFEGIEADDDAAEVGDVFAGRGLAVDVQRIEQGVAVELLHDAVHALVEALAVGLAPPLVQVAVGVVLAALVVEAMGEFVANGAGPGVAVHQRVVGVGV